MYYKIGNCWGTLDVSVAGISFTTLQLDVKPSGVPRLMASPPPRYPATRNGCQPVEPQAKPLPKLEATLQVLPAKRTSQG